VLAAIDIETPPPPADPLDLVALQAHHRDIRASLEAAMPVIAAEPDAARRMANYGRDRLARNPYSPTLPTSRGR
jgi:hypothetical protein